MTYYYGRDGKEILGIREENSSGELPFILKDLQYIKIERFKRDKKFSDKALRNKIAGMIAGALSLSWSPQ